MGPRFFDDDDRVFGDDFIDYMNRTGVYKESEDEEDFDDELLLAGLDRDELEEMDEDERREALEDAGIDPDDWDEF